MFLSRTWLICRVCMQQTKKMVDLFSRMSERPLWNLLRDCGGIPVRKNDNLPDKICENCLQRLWKVYAFRLDCQRAHRAITQVVEPKFESDREFLSDPQLDKSSLLDKYHTRVIERFEAGNGNGYLGSHESIDTFSKSDGDTVISFKLNNEQHLNNSNEDEFVDVYLNKAIENYSTNENISKETKERDCIETTTSSKNKPNAQSVVCCKICKKVYSSAELLRHHMYTHIKPHMCRVCGKQFSQKQQYTNHMNSHSGKQPYACRICTKVFADTSNRNKHEITIHKRRCVRKFPKTRKCLICNRTFSSLSTLRNHHRRIHLKSLETPK